MNVSALDRFLEAAEKAFREGTCSKLTLGKYRGPTADLENVFVRPIALQSGPRLSFVSRFKTRDETKNYTADEAIRALRAWVPAEFRDAHLFTPLHTYQFSGDESGGGKLRVLVAKESPKPVVASHDRDKARAVPAETKWLVDLGIAAKPGIIKPAMTAKFRQINRFVELLSPVVEELAPKAGEDPLRVLDMGCGKGYLTFGVASAFGGQVSVTGVERRPELVSFCSSVANRHGLSNLAFQSGEIANQSNEGVDLLIALHACDTATDDAIAGAVAANARAIVVAPCCQKELRPQLTPPEVLAPALRHGIFQERHAEFATDALRALLLEWAGYRTRVFEFISTEHTAKNLMITAVKRGPARAVQDAEAVRALARFYGVRAHHLAARFAFEL